MANSVMDAGRSAILVEQSRVRAIVRRMLWEDYPGNASARTVEQVCALVFARLGIELERRR